VIRAARAAFGGDAEPGLVAALRDAGDGARYTQTFGLLA
jgi:hypothetical protein